MADPSRHELVVVALPRVDDYVNKISSEPVPHVTLLYLGEVDWDDEELRRVSDYIEHATSQLFRFGLGVDRRGILGPNKADVLFFDKSWSFKKVERFRNNLLLDRNINDAYMNAPQFPEWTPHLTLGFPETPAKPDERDYPVGWVEFDRISLWTHDSDGPVYQLKNHDWDGGDVVSMTDIRMGMDFNSFLEHYGVKGMKWGTRKDRKWAKNIYTTRSAVKVHNAMAHRMNNGEIDKHNADPRWTGKNLNENPKLATLYYKEFAKLQEKVYSQAVADVHGVSPSGSHRAVYVNDNNGPRIEIRDANARHVDEVTEPDLVIQIKQNALGQVEEINTAEEGIAAHSAADEFLAHYGVKGMKWGQRKKSSRQTEPNSADANRTLDIKARVKTQKTTRILSNQELRESLDRMRLEQEFSKLSGGLDKTRIQKSKAFVGKLLIDTGKQNVEQVVKGQSQGLINEALKNAGKK